MPYHAKQQGHTQNVTGEPWRVERRVLPMNIHHNQSRSAECRLWTELVPPAPVTLSSVAEGSAPAPLEVIMRTSVMLSR
jgi:hypothetical protein